jgi:hypothetical protein
VGIGGVEGFEYCATEQGIVDDAVGAVSPDGNRPGTERGVYFVHVIQDLCGCGAKKAHPGGPAATQPSTKDIQTLSVSKRLLVHSAGSSSTCIERSQNQRTCEIIFRVCDTVDYEPADIFLGTCSENLRNVWIIIIPETQRQK